MSENLIITQDNLFLSSIKTNKQWPLIVDYDLAFWKAVVLSIRKWHETQKIAAMKLILVVPFVQLITPLQHVWRKTFGDGFLPRIETTQTWTARVGGVHDAGLGPHLDPVLDYFQAKEWLEKLGHQQSLILTDALVDPLVQMASELVHAAGATPPLERTLFWRKAKEITEQVPAGVAGVEAALGPLAVAWAQATEQWATDVLFDLAQQSHIQKSSILQSGLVVLQAGGEERLAKNIYQQWSDESRLWLNLDVFSDHSADFSESTIFFLSPEKRGSPVQGDLFDSQWEHGEVASDGEGYTLDKNSFDPMRIIAQKHPPQWQCAKDAEDEAELAAARVINLLNAGVYPVALCSQDRPIARRVWALLQRQKITLADETGWTLSTMRCAALVMGFVNAALPNASPDVILDALKTLPPNSSFANGLNVLEKHLRNTGVSQWPTHAPTQWGLTATELLMRINALLTDLYGHEGRTLWEHLEALYKALKSSLAWSFLMADEAGREVLQVLYLYELEQQKQSIQSLEHFSAFAAYAKQVHMDYLGFARWINRTLESVTFIPDRPSAPQVVFLPLARVMLRPFPAVVIPGCDDSRLTAPPSFPGFWSESDRVELGLMSRAQWWERLQAQWVQALRLPQVFLIWRSHDGSQPLGPATLVERVLPDTTTVTDSRRVQTFNPEPTWVPTPQPVERFPVTKLSASSYKKLRDCPYKFYAEHLLRLYRQDELSTDLTRRDYGNWIHAVLRQFHLKRTQCYPHANKVQDQVLLDDCAKEYAADLDQASLIPWQAKWPALRDAYLRWLKMHECDGGCFAKAEFAMDYAICDELILQGRIDRMDMQDSYPVLIDYKTERRSKTQARVKDRYEEIQLPFYALLAQGKMRAEPGSTIQNSQHAQAVYLSLDDQENAAKDYALDDLSELKDLLAQGILEDVRRLKAGFPAYPLGQAQACTYCDVEGLCRKAFWADVVWVSTGEGIES